MRIDGITPLRASNLQRASLDGARSRNEITFREVLASIEEIAPDAAPLASPSTWSAADADAFALFAEANRRTESGGIATFSTLRTTAGASHRASFGVAQLSIREHLSRIGRESDARLAALGTSRAELDAMRERGEAAAAWYHVLVDRRDVHASATRLGLDAAQSARVAQLAEAGDAVGLGSLVGARFATTTGMPASALDEMLVSRALRDPRLGEAFATQYAHDHGVDFDPAHRSGPRMIESARHLVLAHPELDPVLARLGGDEGAAASLAHYLGVGDTTENLLGWHARAASTVSGGDSLASLLSRIDATTSRSREIDDFERALAAVSRVPDLEGDARVDTLARIGRAFHGSPTRARAALFEDGRLDSPRCSSRAELEATLDALRSERTWSDQRLAEQIAHVRAERSTS